MSALPLTVSEFERLLSYGRGKALLYLQQHDPTPYREAILRCVLKNTACDPQVEGTRITYLMEVIAACRDTIQFREAIFTALQEQQDGEWDFSRLFALASEFAERGDQGMLTLMYEKSRELFLNDKFHDWGEWYPLIQADGVKAFVFIVNLLEPKLLKQPDNEKEKKAIAANFYELESLLQELEEKLGVKATEQALRDATQDRPVLAAAVRNVYQFRQERDQERDETKQRSKQPQPPLPYAEIKTLIAGNKRVNATGWGKEASDEDLRQAAQDMITLLLTPRQLGAYLKIFWKRPFPLNDLSFLLQVARQHEPQPDEPQFPPNAFSALNVLENIAHPEVRAFALEMIEKCWEVGKIVGLLRHNFEASDWQLIQQIMTELDEDELHSLGFAMRAILKLHPSLQATSILIYLFENLRCSMCRESIVEALVNLSAVPDWIAEECRYDSNVYLREYAERGFLDDSAESD